MIKATQFHYEFIKQINRIDSGYNKKISVAARDSYFNHAKEVVLENFYALSEINTTIRNHLRLLEKKKQKLSVVRSTSECVVFKFPDKYYRALTQWAIFKTKDCDKKRRLRVFTIQTDDVNESLKDPYWEPSFEWEETFGEEGNDGYYVYKKPEHEIVEFYMDYMFKPDNIAAPSLLDQASSYTNAAGEQVSQDSDFIIDSTFLWRKIVDVAVVYALRDLGLMNDFEAKLKEILFTDKLYMQ